MSEKRTGKSRQINMRADEATAIELQELAELLSTPYVKATITDAIRALIKVGAPILREQITGERDRPAIIRARSTSAEREPAARNKKKRERT